MNVMKHRILKGAGTSPPRPGFEEPQDQTAQGHAGHLLQAEKLGGKISQQVLQRLIEPGVKKI
jgi:hypothetical protein